MCTIETGVWRDSLLVDRRLLPLFANEEVQYDKARGRERDEENAQ